MQESCVRVASLPTFEPRGCWLDRDAGDGVVANGYVCALLFVADPDEA